MIRIYILFVLYFITISCKTEYITSFNEKLNNPRINKVLIRKGKLKKLNGEKFVGLVHVKENTIFPKCDYSLIIKELQNIAIVNNANLVTINDFTYKNTPFSPCYRIEANLYYSFDLEKYKKESQTNSDTLTKAYSYLYIYRFDDRNLFKYELYMDDKLLFEVKPQSKRVIKINRNGKHKLFFKNNKKDSITFISKKSENFFFKVEVKQNILKNKPYLEQVNDTLGLLIYDSW